MGRSKNSQNRIYLKEGDTLKTKAANPGELTNPNNIIYNVMKVKDFGQLSVHVVSNGVQTDTVIAKETANGEEFFTALNSHYCEDDEPTFTSRITGIQFSDNNSKLYISIIKADPFAKEEWLEAVEKSGLKRTLFHNKENFLQKMKNYSSIDTKAFPSIREKFMRKVIPGFGYCVTTYDPGHESLSPFSGLPFIVPLEEIYLRSTMHSFWNHLEPEWRVALAGKEIYPDGYFRIVKPINTRAAC